MIVALTFDVDCQTYLDDRARKMPDELELALDVLRPVFERHPAWRATWFLRIDPEVDMFDRQKALLADLIRAGHGIGWHYHGPIKRIGHFARTARSRKLDVSRVGFGRGTNQVMRSLADAGFSIDSTAMPRPTYPWTRRGVDWTTTSSAPYHPSVSDYRVSGSPALKILEVPISCVTVSAPGDDQQVVRYLNPAYHPASFEPGVERWLARHGHLVTITHPYEVLGLAAHRLLAFDPAAFEENVASVERIAGAAGQCEFITLAEIARRPLREVAIA